MIKRITFEECGVAMLSFDGTGGVTVTQSAGHALMIGVEYDDGARREVEVASGVETRLPAVP